MEKSHSVTFKTKLYELLAARLFDYLPNIVVTLIEKILTSLLNPNTLGVILYLSKSWQNTNFSVT